MSALDDLLDDIAWDPPGSTVQAARAELAALRARIADLEMITRDDRERCEVCGWTLSDSRDNGCVAGDCSAWPTPKEPE